MSQLQSTTVTGVVTQTVAASSPNELVRKGEFDAALAAKLDASDGSTTNARVPTGGAGGDLTGTYPNPTLAPIGAGGSGTKVTVDAKGRVTAVAAAGSADLPTHASRHKSGGDDAIRLDELAVPTGSVALNAQKITGLADPTLAQDGATKAYVDARRLDQAALPTGSVALNAQKITGLADPTLAQDGATKAYVDARRLDQAAAPTGSVALNAQKITGLADPTAAQDGATKAYVDGVKSALSTKTPCRLASTANLSLSGLAVIDGVTPVAGDRILAKDQTSGAQNGLYVAAAGAWSRATDADADVEVKSGLTVQVEEGSANAGSEWLLTTVNPITVGTTSLVFTQSSGAGQITAGTALSKSGNTLNVTLGTSGSSACAGNDSRLSDSRQMAAATADVNFNSHKGTNLTDPSSAQDAATKAYVDARKLNEAAAPTAAVALNAQKITGLADPTLAQDAATKAYVDARRLDQAAAPTGAVALNAQKITGLADPTLAQDAVTLAYLQATVAGFLNKTSVRVATTANHALTGLAAIDGVTPVAGDRVLVKDQTTGSQNGIYLAASGAWSRATDADMSAEVKAGLYCFVTEGTVNGDSGWQLTTNDPITLDTTSLTFTQFTGAGQVTAGTGLVKSGNQLAVDTANLEWRSLKAPTAAPSMNSQRLTDLAAPTSANDAARKAYVDTGNTVGRMVFVDFDQGNDSTGTRGRRDLPFDSLAAAKSAANSGDTIVVLPGTYETGGSLLKNGVNWLFLPGAIVEADSGGTEAIWDDLNSAVTSRVDGWGVFTEIDQPVMRVAHTSSVVSIAGAKATTAGTTDGVVQLSGGTVRIDIPQIINTGGPGIYIEDMGVTCNFRVNADEIRGSTFGIKSLYDGATIQLKVRALDIVGETEAAVDLDITAGQTEIIGARIKAETAAKLAVLCDGSNVLTLRQCALVAGAGAAASIDAAGAVNVRNYGHLPMNVAKSANITFSVGNGQVEVDADVL